MNIFLDMVGCRLNQAEIEQMARQFRAEGHSMVGAASAADLVVINTCSVTAKAASDSRQKIRQAARAGAPEIFVTGCWATLQPEQAAQLSNVVKVFPNQEKDHLVTGFSHRAEPAGQPAHFDLEPIARQPIPGLRQRTRAFIKAQDGCDNACTFCITTIARGAGRSRPASKVITDIQAALQGGAHEIVLTGVHLGSWGQDFNLSLGHLVVEILQETNPARLRLSSLEPWDIDEDFLTLWNDPRLCPHLHLPLQSGSAATLKRMARKTSPDAFRSLVETARRLIPDVAITTDIIAGFPSESQAEFEETLAFVQEINFAGGHVFTYSARPTTPAARIREQVPHEIRKERSLKLHSAFGRMSAAYRQQFIGQTLPVLWEASAIRDEKGWKIEGLTGNYIRVSAIAPELRWNQMDMVKLNGLNEDGMSGEIINSGKEQKQSQCE